MFSELSALRRQLRSEQRRLEGRLQQGDWEELDSPLSERSNLISLDIVMDPLPALHKFRVVYSGDFFFMTLHKHYIIHLSRHWDRPPVDVFDMARLRLQAPVRRPNSRNTLPRNLLRIHDSLQLKYAGNKNRTKVL